MSLDRLTSAQARVVAADADRSHLLVRAPPGSGKTLTITRRIEFLLEQGLAEPEQIMALTFSRRAAGELVGRLAENRREGVFAGTFHAFCADWLSQRGAGTGVPLPLRILDETGRQALLDELLSGFGMNPTLGDIQIAGHWIGDQKCERADTGRTPPFDEAFGDRLLAEYRAELRSRRMVDFDDLILETNRILKETAEEAARLRKTIRFVCVDEFHDVSPDQYQLLTLLAPPRMPGRQVLIVLDPNQSIYGFRGANALDSLQVFQRDYDAAQHQLTENFRSNDQIIAAAKQVIESGGAEERSVPQRQGEHAVHCCGYADANVEAVAVVDMIQRAVAAGFQPSAIAILYRRHVRVDAIEQALIAAEIPIERIGPDRFFDGAMAREALRYLALLQGWGDREFQSVLNWPRHQVDELSMAHLLQLARAAEMPLNELITARDLLQNSCTPLTANAVRQMMLEVIEPLAPYAGGAAREVGERLLTSLQVNRPPSSAAHWLDFKAALLRIDQHLDAALGALPPAIENHDELTVLHDASADATLAAAVLCKVLQDWLGRDVSLAKGAVEGVAVTATNPETGGSTAIALPPRSEMVGAPLPLRAFRLAQRLLGYYETLAKGRFVAVDIETTGLHWVSNEILQIGACVIENGEITDRVFERLVRPRSEESITPAAQSKHGIRWQDVENAPLPVEAITDFIEFAGTDILVGHNVAGFDIPVLRRVAEECGLAWPSNPVIDTCLIARRLHPNDPARLDDLLTEEERASRTRHDAVMDACLTGLVFLRLAEEVRLERETAALPELLPVVSAAIRIAGVEDELDYAPIADAGAAAWHRGLGRAFAERAFEQIDDALTPPLREWLSERGVGVNRTDRQWVLFIERWGEALAEFDARQSGATLAEFLTYVRLSQPIDLERGAESRVKLMTIHAAKGLEWDVVFVVGVEQNEFVFNDDPAEVEEGRRVLYVGMTRARERVILTWIKRHDREGRKLCEFVFNNLGAFVPIGTTKDLVRTRSSR